MKPVSDEYKQAIKQFGREIKTEITYNDGEEHLLDGDVLFSITPAVNGNILKSVMKQLDFESSVKVPKDTIIAVRFGVKVGTDYEYINFGNYIVSEEPEYNADTQTYSHVCYDKLLYSMKDYERLDITYPTTIREYINAICQHLGLIFKNNTDTFANYDKPIKLDLYDGQGYKFRDILDELAQVTASTICINEITDELEIRYLNDTQEVIDEDYLKDVNVEFAEKYGPINSIVLSRSGESDNIYLQNETSVQLNGLCELKIIDNQIMNDNDRSIFLPDILSKLDGITYYINDFNSTGITWFELCDKYAVQIGDNQYSCALFNDEIKITQGLEETIYTEMPTVSETDYTKADKTDRKINQTYLMVDKQNQKIESVISNVTEQNQKIAGVTQTVDELNSKISDIINITESKESLNGTVSFEKVNQSEPIYVRIYPTGENISYLYPNINLFPSETLYLKVRTLRFINTTTNEYVDYELPTDLLYYDAENYDEFILDYDAQTCVVNKRVGYNADGTTYLLETPTTIEYDFPKIQLTDGDYTITLLGYHNAYMFVRLMSQNIYTTQFATKAELNSEISQTESEINLSVDKKLTSYPTTTQMNSALSVKANEITSTVSKTYATKNELTTAKSEIKQTTDGISSEVSKKVGNDEIISKINQSAEAVGINANKIELSANDVLNLLAGNTINLSGKQIKISSNNFTVDENGKATMKDVEITGGSIILNNNATSYNSAAVKFNSSSTKSYMSSNALELYYNDFSRGIGISQDGINGPNQILAYSEDGSAGIGFGEIWADGNVYAANISSDIRLKENINKSTVNALKKLNEIEVKSFDWKKDKKHIKAGFIAQELEKVDENFVIKRQIKDKEGNITDYEYYVNELPIIATILKAVQEQQNQIEELQNEINELKGEKEDEQS